MSALKAKERSPLCLGLLFTRRSCWGREFRMAQPSAGLALFVCARIVKDTDVLDIIIVTQNNHLEPNFQQNRKLSNLYFYVNSRHDSKRKLLFGELEAVKECGWGFGRLLGGQAGQTKQYFKVKLREFSLFDLVSLVKVLQKSN